MRCAGGATVCPGVTIGDDVFIGPSATFTNDRVPRAFNTEWKITLRDGIKFHDGTPLDSAALVSGTTLKKVDAYGKHLLLRFEGDLVRAVQQARRDAGPVVLRAVLAELGLALEPVDRDLERHDGPLHAGHVVLGQRLEGRQAAQF